MSIRLSKKNLSLVKSLVEELKPTLFLEGWVIEIKIYDGPCVQNEDIAAQCASRNQYKEADIDFYPRFFSQTKRQQRDIVLHELLHIVTAIQNSVIQSSRGGNAVSPAEAAYAFEEETSWIEKIIASLL